MEFTLSLTKEDIEMMLSKEFGHDVQLEKLYVQMEDQDLPDIIDFNGDHTFMVFQLENRKTPKQEVKYNDGRDYSID